MGRNDACVINVGHSFSSFEDCDDCRGIIRSIFKLAMSESPRLSFIQCNVSASLGYDHPVRGLDTELHIDLFCMFRVAAEGVPCVRCEAGNVLLYAVIPVSAKGQAATVYGISLVGWWRVETPVEIDYGSATPCLGRVHKWIQLLICSPVNTRILKRCVANAVTQGLSGRSIDNPWEDIEVVSGTPSRCIVLIRTNIHVFLGGDSRNGNALFSSWAHAAPR